MALLYAIKVLDRRWPNEIIFLLFSPSYGSGDSISIEVFLEGYLDKHEGNLVIRVMIVLSNDE